MEEEHNREAQHLWYLAHSFILKCIFKHVLEGDLGNEVDIWRRKDTVLPEARKVSGRYSHPQLHLVRKMQKLIDSINSIPTFSHISAFIAIFLNWQIFLKTKVEKLADCLVFKFEITFTFRTEYIGISQE